MAFSGIVYGLSAIGAAAQGGGGAPPWIPIVVGVVALFVFVARQLRLQQVAGAAGTAAFVTVAAVASNGPPGPPDATGLRAGFVAAGVIGLLTIVTALFVRGKQPDGPSREVDKDARAGERPTPVAGH